MKDAMQKASEIAKSLGRFPVTINVDDYRGSSCRSASQELGGHSARIPGASNP